MTGAALYVLLDRVDNAVTRADLGDLAELATLMEAAVQDFDPAIDANTSRMLSDRAAQVTTRLDAARRGVQAARRRMQEIRAACELRTYDRAGQAHNLAAGPNPTPHRF
ncbi:hypothetical protein [Fuscibacter oryzae]|uniref:Uncharacterized protein n=1 Tax=Fuscibacter oryzae TaxID=2803939 RepID=A0A8J7MVL5_9RHOB|nr:hypothetical protein [Fuscibacter oryzae]MBL4928369.1 hypothetical protein [Fuscibacter oryzae]